MRSALPVFCICFCVFPVALFHAAGADERRNAPATADASTPVEPPHFLDTEAGGVVEGLFIASLIAGFLLYRRNGKLRALHVERDDAEARLAASESRFRALFDQSPDPCFLVARDGTVLHMNSAARTRLGPHPDATLSLSAILSDCPTCDGVSVLWSRTADGSEARSETVLRRPGGGFVPVETLATRVSDDAGECVLLIARDLTDQRRAEQESEESRRRLEYALAASRDGLWDWNLDTGEVYYSPRWFSMLGYEPGGFPPVVETWTGLLDPDVRDAVQIEAQERIARDGWYEMDFPMIAADGGRRWILSRGSVVERADDGRPIRMVGIHTDITTRRREAEALRRAKERLEAALSAASIGTWRWDPKTDIDTRDAGLNAMLGLAAEETRLPVSDFTSRIHPEDRDDAEAALDTSLRTGIPYDTEVRIIRSDGEVRWVRDRGRPYFSEDGELEYVTGAVVDVTERKRLEDEISRTRDLYLAILDDAPALIRRSGRDGLCNWFNETWLDFTGRSLAQETGDGWVENVHPDDREHCMRAHRDAFRLRKASETEYRLRRCDGAYRWIFDVGRPFEDTDGAFGGYIGYCLDITDRREAEAALRRALEEASQANRELEQFSYIASHDLQEPLRKISAFGERLRDRLDGRLDERSRDYFDRMTGAAERMRALIRDLLSFSRAANSDRPFTDVELDAVVREALDDLQPRIEETDASVDMDALPLVHGDAPLLRQVFCNLVGNALKYRRPDVAPRIRIGKECPEAPETGATAFWAVTVEDNGIGFDPKYAEQIFQPFRRLHGRGEYQGAGIGLAICRRVVERHGGTLIAESTPGEGSRFVMTLPVRCDRQTSECRLRQDGTPTGRARDATVRESSTESPAAPH